MVIFKKIADLQEYLKDKKAGSAAGIGFIPTMGALHDGHTSLVKTAKKAGNIAVASIFVNPTQFNDPEDFKKYPLSTDKDVMLLTEAGCDILFLPEVGEIYPGGLKTGSDYSFGYLDTVFEGAHRPGHFKGVGQVVARLLNIVQPDTLYLGQKDYQQCMVVKSLMEQEGVHKAELVIGNTVREDDGLAMSSRNRRLTEPQRALAGLLYQCLVSIQAKQTEGNFTKVQRECNDLLVHKGFEPDYIALAHADTLEEMHDYDAGHKTVALIAAKIGDIRLIDNMLLN
ncbi:MAG: pantoate--beta-alanine ligase [Sphingobacteriales bacterium]|nr:MAG: pantoate--beta-alanine ligase [Sphingobacteriales bacterium]